MKTCIEMDMWIGIEPGICVIRTEIILSGMDSNWELILTL